jgi:hypothetical protein
VLKEQIKVFKTFYQKFFEPLEKLRRYRRSKTDQCVNIRIPFRQKFILLKIIYFICLNNKQIKFKSSNELKIRPAKMSRDFAYITNESSSYGIYQHNLLAFTGCIEGLKF